MKSRNLKTLARKIFDVTDLSKINCYLTLSTSYEHFYFELCLVNVMRKIDVNS